MLPLPHETELKHAESRPFPNIYLSRDQQNVLFLGLTCNTIESVEKMRNILLPHQNEQKQLLISYLKKLDPQFKLSLLAKLKDHWSSIPTYRTEIELPSRDIDDISIIEIFRRADVIRKRGKEVPAVHSKNYPSETPVLELASAPIQGGKEEFVSKLGELKLVLQTCLRIRTKAEFDREEATRPKRKIVEYRCSKCGLYFSEDQYRASRFCPDDGMRILVIIRYE